MENRIKELRKRDGLTQEDLAERMETGKSMISMLESGERRLNTDWINKLCNVFSVRPNEIFVSDLDYKEIILSEKATQLGPDGLRQLDEYADFLLQKQKRHIAEQS
jgi:transcriptional regulator with XRE-family HTH domain